MGWTKIKTFTLFACLTLAGLSACNRVGDQYCEVPFNPTDLNDQCPYGEADRLEWAPPGQACPSPGEPDATCDTSITWATDIWPELNQNSATDRRCSRANCHLNGEGRGIILTDSPDQAWNVLSRYLGGTQTFYVGDPKSSWILCNLRPPGGDFHLAGGITMPPGGLPTDGGDNDTLYFQIKEWVRCGQPSGLNASMQ